uniref:uncharacterized protein LOC120342418 n=1 Tax=Styela clava TaxID=7725 RepID=UPI00193A7C61|nr:uncharacterized protein LOC120342418 [Styela clava]
MYKKMNFGNETVTAYSVLNNGSLNSNESATNNTFMNSTAASNQTFNFIREDSNDYVVNVILTLSQVVGAILISLSCSMLASFVVYCIQNGKWKSKRRTKFFNGRLIYILYAIVIGFFIQKLLITQVYIQAPRGANSSTLCNAIDAAAKLYYSITIYLVYFFLWVRQRVIYDSTTAGKIVTRLSWGIFAMLPSEIIQIIIKLIIFDRPYPMPQGCIHIKNNSKFLHFFMHLPLVLAQFTLLGLLVYPLVKNTMEYKSRYHDSKSIIVLCITGTSKSSKIQNVIRRVTIWTFVAVITDILFAVINFRLIPEHFPISVRATAADVMIFGNIICIYMTLKDRWQILRVFFPKKQNKIVVVDISTKLTKLPQTKDSCSYTSRHDFLYYIMRHSYTF